MRPALPFAVAALVVLPGCSTVGSKDIETSGLTADLVATTAGTYSEVTATYRVGTLTYVEFGKDERISVSGGDESVELDRRRLAAATVYAGVLKTATPGTEVTFDLQRTDHTSAPRSTVTLPEPVEIISPSAGTSVSRRGILVLEIRPGPEQELSWEGPCVQSGTLRIEAGRSTVSLPRRTIQAASAVPATTPATPPSSSCQITVKLTRKNQGILDPAYKDGSIIAQAVATKQILSVP